MTHPEPPHRVSAVPFPERFDLPSRPTDPSPAVQDAHRQTKFLLGRDLDLFERAMNLQLRIISESSHSQYRNHPYSALVGLWSRTYLYLTDACALVTGGSYASALPLVRAACECVAAQAQLQQVEMEHYFHWLHAALRNDDARKAVDVEMGRYFAGETLAADSRLRSIYRAASELARPNFGATVLQVGPESNNVRLALTFGDRAFHAAWAQLTLGWLLALAERQLHAALEAKGVFAPSDDSRAAYETVAADIDEALGDSSRCRIEEIEEGQQKRFLVHSFRRTTASSPKRLLL